MKTRQIEIALNNLVAIQADIKALKRKEAHNREILINSGLTELETNEYLCKITGYKTRSVDYKAIIDRLKITVSRQMLTAYTKYSHRTKITINNV